MGLKEIKDAIIGGKKYRKCQKEADGSISCVAYSPTRDGKKIPTASIKANLTPECTVSIDDSDGNPEDITELEEYLGQKAKIKCNKNQEGL